MSKVCGCGRSRRISFVLPESWCDCGTRLVPEGSEVLIPWLKAAWEDLRDDCGCDVGLVKDPTDSFGWRDSINAIVRDVYDRIEALERGLSALQEEDGAGAGTCCSGACGHKWTFTSD